MYARWITFLSSRTLPGQECVRRPLERGGGEALGGALSLLSSSMKCSASSSMSSRRVAQRRQLHRQHVQPVEQVLAQLARGDRLVGPPVGRGDHADVHVDHVGAADAVERPRLQHAQQLDLQLGGISVISSRNSVPRLRALEEAACERSAPVKLPRSCPNSSLSISVGRDGAAVDGHEGFLRAAAHRVDRLRDEVLAGAGLAEHQDTRVRGGDARQEVVEPLHALARPDQRAEAAELAQLAAQAPDLALQLAGAERFASTVLTRAKSTGLVR
jgi:hypothetical protein